VGTTRHESHDSVEDRVRELCDAARELDRALEAAAAIPPRLLRGTHETMTVASSSGHAFGEYHPAVATVTVNNPLTAADADAEVRHLEVATADLRRAPGNSESTTGISDVNADERSPLYTPGDCLAVLPLPLAECDVTRARDATGTVLERAGLAPDAWVTLRAPGGGHLGSQSEFISKPVRAASLVEGALDLTSASARRYFFEVASTFASHPQEAERLRHFAGKDGRDELWYYNERERRSVGEFLSDFPSVSMPLEWMLTTAPRLRHRLFSIASSPLPHPHSIHLTVTAARWKTHYGRIREGLCSNVLARCVSTFIFTRAIRLTSSILFIFCVQRSSRRRAGVLARPDRDGSTEGYHAPAVSVHWVRGGAAQGVRAGTGPQGTGMSIEDCAHVGILRMPEKGG
jgi:sulfite reductase alpha subunit-like flavoprotein